MQRILLVIGGLVVVGGVAAGVYFFFFAGGADLSVEPQDTTTFPDAGEAPLPDTTEQPQVVDVGQPQKVSQRLVRISKGPVALGAVAYAATSTTASTTDTVVNFIARESGNVYQYTLSSGSVTRISNKTIPGVQEAKWLPDGSLAYVRYLSGEARDTINTYALPKSGEGGYFLSQNIAAMAVAKNSILSLASGSNGSIATLSRIDGSNGKQVFVSPASSLSIGFLGATQYLAYTKPASALPGYAYAINSLGLFERLAGPLNGLVALGSPSGKWVLLSYTANNNLQLALLNVASRELIALPVGTVADKCVWTSTDATVYCGVPRDVAPGSYPDDWYQGVISFSDQIWKIDVAGRFAERVLDFTKETEQGLDATSFALDPRNTMLVFRNKKDASLWLYEL